MLKLPRYYNYLLSWLHSKCTYLAQMITLMLKVRAVAMIRGQLGIDQVYYTLVHFYYHLHGRNEDNHISERKFRTHNLVVDFQLVATLINNSCWSDDDDDDDWYCTGILCQRRNNLQICPRRDSNTGDSDLWSNTLRLDHGGAHAVYLVWFIKKI